MHRTLLALALLAFSGISNAGMDYSCLEKCSAEGSPFTFCTTKCSVQDFPTTQVPVQSEVAPASETQDAPVPRTEPNCIDACTNDGYAKDYCQQRCTF